MSSSAKSPAKSSASFRDPCGFVFHAEDTVYRQINAAGRADYEHLMSSGLYDALVGENLLIAHSDADIAPHIQPEHAWKIIKPEPLAFVSYPYEWSFSQLKAAALTTLEIQRRAIEHGMTLKDASAYNIQFIDNQAVFIDTLSLQIYQPDTPWVAYRQFCQHFLAPLALMSKCDVRLNRLSQLFIDGVPLDMASAMLPWSSKLSLSLGLHIVLHARSQRAYAHKQVKPRAFSKHAFLALIDSLKSAVTKLKWLPGGTEWHDYYDANNNYGDARLTHKDDIVEAMVSATAPRCVWDLGANVGRYSHIAARTAERVIAWDIDPSCVESHVLSCRENNVGNVLPLWLDLTNPSPGIGWNNVERASLLERRAADLVLALGLVHHLAISNNVPLAMIAELFAALGDNLIVEFIPKTDSQVEKLLSTREDVFPDYTIEGFRAAFGAFYSIVEEQKIPDTQRTVFRMVKVRS